MTISNPYEILGLRGGASKKDVHKAYRRLVKAWHPDRFPNPELQREAQQRIRAINEAYRVLSEGPARPAALRRASAVQRERLWPAILAVLAVSLLLFAALYVYFRFREDAGRLIVNGVSFREWEWERSFHIGSTKDEVLAVQGPPARASGDQWFYGKDVVYFFGGRVAAISNPAGTLKISKFPFAEKPVKNN